MTRRKLLNDCFLTDKDRVSHEECLEILTGRLSAVTGTEELPLVQTSGRWLAADIIAPRNVPLHDNSAVDGYAFAAPATSPMPIVARIAAGIVDLAIFFDTAARSTSFFCVQKPFGCQSQLLFEFINFICEQK